MRGCTAPFVSSYVCAKPTENHSEASFNLLLRCLLMAGFHMRLKGALRGKEDAAVLPVHTCFTGEFLREVKSY